MAMSHLSASRWSPKADSAGLSFSNEGRRHGPACGVDDLKKGAAGSHDFVVIGESAVSPPDEI